MKRGVAALLLGVLAFLGVRADAHEVRPAYLQITETTDRGYEVLWKKPTMGEMAIHLVPHLGDGWLDGTAVSSEASAGFAIARWVVAPGPSHTLAGRVVSIEGLENTITDVLVIVRRADGLTSQYILTPTHTAQVLPGAMPVGMDTAAFVVLGIDHIMTGVDHLLFVLGLLLLIENRRMLLKTITAFTLAHSFTLALATVGHVQVPVPFVNAMVALSILFLGPEIIRRWSGGTSFTIRNPWVVAFAFGLLHGFGFASGLTTIGLPTSELLLALLSFNAGVEIGQLTFVALTLWLGHAFQVLAIRWPQPLQRLPAYAIGTMGAFWTIQYIAVLLDGTS